MNLKKNSKAYVEVLDVLYNIPKEQFRLVPNEIIQFLEENKDKNYKFKYNNKKYNLSKESAIILVDIYITYISKPEEKKKIEEILILNEKIEKLS